MTCSLAIFFATTIGGIFGFFFAAALAMGKD